MLRFASAAVVAGLLLLAPVVIAAGPGRSLDLLVRYPLLDFGDYQSLPFPLSYDGPLNLSSPGGFLSDSAENLLEFYVPLVLVIGLVAALALLANKRARVTAIELGTAVFGLGMLHYLLVRPDGFHTAPLAVVLAVLAAWALALPRPRRLLRGSGRGRGAGSGLPGRVRRRPPGAGADETAANRWTSRSRTACGCPLRKRARSSARSLASSESSHRERPST